MTKEQRLELINEAKEIGLKSITIDDVVYEFGESKPAEVEIVPIDPELFARKIAEETFTDEEILYYASPYYDELQEKKKKHEEHLKTKE